jgi:predicted metal-dependent hydrolase
MNPTVTYGDVKFSYVLVRNERLKSKVRIHVHPNGQIEVEAPVSESTKNILNAVRKRGRWIAQRLDAVADDRADALTREYISGETHFYLGRRYQLKIIESHSEPSSVSLKGGYIRVTLPCADSAAVRRRLNEWYRQRASDYFKRRIVEITASISWLKHEPPLKLVKMSKQWGSCSPLGSINLNPWLIRAPRECVDYVITHEICHLREHNHSKRYYGLLSRHLREWRPVKRKLDQMAEMLLAT